LVDKKHILMIGCGNMGGALLTRWQRHGSVFTVVKPSGKPIPGGVVSAGVESVRGPEGLGERKFDMVVIATKPQQIDAAVPAYCKFLAEDGCFVSIAAGASVASIEQVVGECPVIRLMPNMPVAIGEGFTTAFANADVTKGQRLFIDELMAQTGKLLWVESEDRIDRATAIAGSGPGYVYEIARSWVEAGEALGFSNEQAREMVLQTLLGSVNSALVSDQPLATLRDGVTSKNGTTAAGLNALNGDASLDQLFSRTLEAAYQRAVELR
jgi:pyrroline-5-carboxylate reductase